MTWTKSNIYVNGFFVECMTFPGGEVNVRVPSRVRTNADKDSMADVAMIFKSNEDIITLLMVVDALKRQNYKLNKLLIPYFPYARQDRVCNPGEALSVKVVADLINSLGFKKVEIFDPHSDVTPALINNVEVVSALDFILRIPNLSEYVIVSPDAGAEKKIWNIVKTIDCKGLVRLSKQRDLKTGEITGMQLVDHQIPGDAKKFLIVDDICDGGRTFIEASKLLKNYTNKYYHYNPTIDLYVTHGIFSKGFDVFKGYLNTVYCSNSFVQNNKSFYSLNKKEIDNAN